MAKRLTAEGVKIVEDWLAASEDLLQALNSDDLEGPVVEIRYWIASAMDKVTDVMER